MKRLALFLLLGTLVAAQIPAVKPPPTECATGFGTINPDDCKKWLSKLASDEFEGREAGTPGFQKAADFVAAHFKAIGLRPIGDPGPDGKPTYFQNVPFVANSLDASSAVFDVTGGPGDAMHLKVGEGFGGFGATAVDAEGSVVFMVAKTSTKKLDAGAMTTSIVFMMGLDDEGNPASRFGKLGSALKDLDAALVVRINDVSAAQGFVPDGPQRKDMAERGRGGSRPAILYVSREVAGKIAKAAGHNLDEIVRGAKSSGFTKTVTTKLRAKVKVAVTPKDIPVPNVVGILDGSDPKLKDEVVVMGSHLDHLGRAPSGEIFYGADDDGSGSTGIMAVSRAFATNGTLPKRSVMFICVCGEEKGLLGSDWYVEHPIIPIANTVAELQMDMIGRREESTPGENPGNEKAEDNLNTLKLVGSQRLSSQLHELILKENKEHVGFVFEYDQESVYSRSDHYNFARKGIPIAFFFTGFHTDYHKPTDRVEKIDFPKLCRVAKLVYLSAWDIAERPTRPVVDRNGEDPNKGGRRPK